MSMHEVNLVPPSIAARVLRGRASRRAVAASAITGMLALGVAGAARMIDSKSAEQLRAAQAHAAPVIVLEDEIAGLRADRSGIAARLDVQREVGVAIPATPVVRAIASALPSGALLELVTLEYANVQGTNKKIRRTARDAEPQRELRGEVSGIAANEADVGRIIDRLSALAPMSQVSLESSRSREFRGRNAREFRIQFTVDLERRWRLPEIADGSTPSGATEAGGTR